jgi:hypothetical protein
VEEGLFPLSEGGHISVQLLSCQGKMVFYLLEAIAVLRNNIVKEMTVFSSISNMRIARKKNAACFWQMKSSFLKDDREL